MKYEKGTDISNSKDWTSDHVAVLMALSCSEYLAAEINATIPRPAIDVMLQCGGCHPYTYTS